MHSFKGQIGKEGWTPLAFLIALISLGAGAATPAAPPPAQSTEGKDEAQCRKNLEAIRAAIRAYRLDHKDLPEDLAHLVPTYLADFTFLTCPACQRGNMTSDDILRSTDKPNPKITYTYEFSLTPIPGNIAGGSSRTMREWKRLQMSVVGSGVPMVRCHGHGRSLNLSFGGDIFESPPDWEDLYRELVSFEDLTFAKLFSQYTVFQVIRIPQREPTTPVHLLDLTDYYNASLSQGWHDGNPRNNMAQLPVGQVEFAETPFDVRGIIQLTAAKRYSLSHYPRAVSNIVVGVRSRAFRFLHATAFAVNHDLQIGSYEFHYSDGKTAQCPIVYGRHLLDWWSDPQKPGRFDLPNNSQVAWTGTNEARQADDKHIYLYMTHWDNPYPNVEVTSVDFCSAMEPSAPFLIAVTAIPLGP